VTIRDDGQGFDPALGTSGFGLIGIRGRAELLDGVLTVNARPGQGTVVEAKLPLSPVASASSR
jgi:two-component system, NarL family, sensor histidine kinase UhpB